MLISEPGIEVTEQPMRGCADCDTYCIADTLVTRPDGRRICRTCVENARKLREQRSQLEMFCEQIPLLKI